MNPSLPLEPLEPRQLLTATPTLDLFNASPALFVENQGQWPDPSLHYAFNGANASIAFTATGPLFRLSPVGQTFLSAAAPMVGQTFLSAAGGHSC